MTAGLCSRSLVGACVSALFLLPGKSARADEVVEVLSLGVRHELVKDLDLAGGVQLRLDGGFSRVERWLPEATIEYRLVKPLTLGAGYRSSYARNGRGEFELAHRVHVQAGLGFKLKPMGAKLKYRLRLQDRFERNEGEPTEHQPTLRNALELSYTDWQLLRPFISAEHYLALDELVEEPTRRWKFILGVQHDWGPVGLELYYRLDLRVANDDPNRHMIGLGMRLEL